MNRIKITNKVPYLGESNDNGYKKIYEYILILNNKGYSFTRKRDLKSFLYERIKDKTYNNKNHIDEQRVSCIVTTRKTIKDVVKVHIYDLFNISSFWDNYWYIK